MGIQRWSSLVLFQQDAARALKRGGDSLPQRKEKKIDQHFARSTAGKKRQKEALNAAGTLSYQRTRFGSTRFPHFSHFPDISAFSPKNDATSLIGSFGKQLVFGAEHKLASQWRRQMGEHLQISEFS